MKFKFSVIAFLSVFALSSCSKDNSDEKASAKLTCTIDGVTKTFNTNSAAVRYNANELHSVQIVGFEDGNVESHLNLGIGGEQEITTGDYTEDGGDENNTRVAVLAYGDSDNDYVSDDSETSPAKITITSISSTSVQGTFSGDVFLVNGTGTMGTKKTITNGNFNLNFQ